jgi:hypothetical protein
VIIVKIKLQKITLFIDKLYPKNDPLSIEAKINVENRVLLLTKYRLRLLQNFMLWGQGELPRGWG